MVDMLLYVFIVLVPCFFAEPRTSAAYLSKVRIKSSLLGKDQFLQQYLQEPGDLFSKEKHERSKERIREKLRSKGFIEARVDDDVYFDTRYGTVAVTLYLEPRALFTISQLQVLLPKRYNELKDELQLLLDPLVSKPAQKELFDEYGKKLISFLVKKGFISPSLTLLKERNASKNQLKVTYAVTLDRRQELIFRGNAFFSTSELLDDMYALKEQGVALPVALLAQDSEDLYRKKGFFQTKITPKEKEHQIIFTIEEGTRSKIASVRVKESFTDSDALAVIQSLENFLTGKMYDEEEITSCLHQAQADLANLGFWQVSFSKQVTPVSKGTVTITLTLTQSGSSDSIRRTAVSTISIPGHELFESQGPFKFWNSNSGPLTLRPRDIEEQRRWLLKAMRQQGYLTATVQYEFKKNDRGEQLVWHIDLQQGPIVFGPVRLAGLYKMKPYVVLRELCFNEKDLWNDSALEQSLKNLRRLGMFESVSFFPQEIVSTSLPDGTQQGMRPLLIKCAEDDPFEILTRFGLQFVSKSFTQLSWSTWKVGGSFVWKNPAGIADRFIIDADWTRYTLNLAASYEVPRIGPLPLRTQFKVYSDRFDQPLISSNHIRLYKESHEGMCVTFSSFYPLWSTCVRTGFEFNKLSVLSREAVQVIQFEPTLVDRRTPYFYVEPSVTFEHFDDKTSPKKGYFTNVSLKTMVPADVPDAWFLRAHIEQSLFYPVYSSVIAAFRWRFGHIFNARFSTILPTERFYLGGANLLWGYETNMVPPLNDFVRESHPTIWVPVGGKTMLNLNAELRFPLYKRLSGVVFTDAGVLTQDKVADIAANKWLGASGFGLRYASPFGPIRFDIGWKWNKRELDDKSYAFFLTFGHAF